MMVTKEQLINIGAEKLSEIILSVSEDRPYIQRKIEIILALFESDTTKIISTIGEEIELLKNSGRFIDYSEYKDFADRINQVRIHIMNVILPKFPGQAIELLLNFLDIHENTLHRVKDNNDEIRVVFQQACADLSEAYKLASPSADVVDLVYNRITNNNYGVYNDIIPLFRNILKDDGLRLLKLKLENFFNQDIAKLKVALKDIADCLNDVTAYMNVCTDYGADVKDYLDVAKRLIKHGRGPEANHWLNKMDEISPIPDAWSEEKQALRIKILDSCGRYEAAQTQRLNLFKTTLSPKVYNEILKHAEVDFIESFKEVAIEKALDFQNPHVALTFLKEIQEFEQAANLVRLKFNTLDLDGSNFYVLRPIADILCKTDQLAATLLYRMMIGSILTGAKSIYYTSAAKDLATCHSLSSKITDWQGFQEHELYFRELSRKHERVTSFWTEYKSALNKWHKV